MTWRKWIETVADVTVDPVEDVIADPEAEAEFRAMWRRGLTPEEAVESYIDAYEPDDDDPVAAHERDRELPDDYWLDLPSHRAA